MLESWRTRAACRGMDPNLFHPSDQTPVEDIAAAQAACVGCPVQVDCLDHSIRAREWNGIWGGLGWGRRVALRRVFKAGDPAGYRDALAAEMRRIRVGDLDPPEPSNDACGRCGAPMRPGPRPIDRNTAGATCGKPSTYNRGCRCVPCVDAKSEYQANEPGRKKTSNGGPG